MEVNLHWSGKNILSKKEKTELTGYLEKIPDIINNILNPLKKSIEPDILNIIIVSNNEIQEINNQFRNKNKPTDVITFPFEKKFKGGNQPSTGEIYISGEMAKEQSLDHNLTLLNELIILIVHGLVHSFDFDHEKSEKDAQKMKKIEIKILDFLSIKDIEPLTE